MKALQVLLFVIAWALFMLALGALGDEAYAMAALLGLAAFGLASVAVEIDRARGGRP